jgi:hypothetical protein
MDWLLVKIGFCVPKDLVLTHDFVKCALLFWAERFRSSRQPETWHKKPSGAF